jgi:hypothetical protein
MISLSLSRKEEMPNALTQEGPGMTSNHPGREADYQAGLIQRLEDLFPGCIVLKNDPNWRQGMPDLMILWGSAWAALEVKSSATSREQPNQRFYVDHMNGMSFAAFIYPGNEGEVLHELQLAFEAIRDARVSLSQ